MYALQNQNVERKIVKKLDITESSPNNINRDTTSIDDLSNNEVTNDNGVDDNDIPQILIPNEEEDNLAHLELETLVNNHYENKVVGSSI
jgi:hypothetical protein